MENRYTNFDYLRGIAIAAVVLIHVTAPTASAEEMGSVILNQVARFGVPVFVFLSGWGLTVAESYEKSETYFSFLKKRLLKLLPAYFVWNGIYLFYAYFFEETSLTLAEIIQGVVFGTNYPHLYFVPLISLFYIFYPLLQKIGQHHIGLLFSLALTLISMMTITLEGLTRNQNPLNWLFYFVFGIWVAEYYERLQKKLHKMWVVPLFILSAIFIVLEPMELAEDFILSQTRPSVIFYSVMLILLVIVLPNWGRKLKNILLPLSIYSFEIYLSHYLFIRLYRNLFPSSPDLILWLLVLISSVGLAKLEEKIT